MHNPPQADQSDAATSPAWPHRPPALAAVVGLGVLLGACGTYEPPQPGQHRGPGEPRSELTCEYAPPTAMVIRSWRCRPAENMPKEEEMAREALESIRLPPPLPP
ncbi:MAG: hypothetical protein ACK5Y8_09630 [Betaproteobacteria bacterium]|jgi:hypothetical protein|nr:hypothetical protein [Rubrivivax sp.]